MFPESVDLVLALVGYLASGSKLAVQLGEVYRMRQLETRLEFSEFHLGHPEGVI